MRTFHANRKLFPFCIVFGFIIFVSLTNNILFKRRILSSLEGMGESQKKPSLALLGAGLFVKDQYVNILRDVSHVIQLKYVWSRSQGPAEEVTALVNEYADASALFGDDGLEKILRDPHIQAVAIVLPALVQPEMVIRALRAGKHVIQEKPVAANVKGALEVLKVYRGLSEDRNKAPIWAVAENYRFEPGLEKAGQMVKELGQVMMVEVIIESPMNAGNRYFSSEWRRDPAFLGAFLIDGGVHFIAGARMIVGCEVTSVSAITSHKDKSLPPPDNVAAVMQFENGASGTMVISYSAISRKVSWRIVCEKGTVEAERGSEDGKHGYFVTLYPSSGAPEKSFFPFEGVQNELKAFAMDVANAHSKVNKWEADLRSSPIEAIRDLALAEAMVASGVTKTSNVAVESIM